MHTMTLQIEESIFPQLASFFEEFIQNETLQILSHTQSDEEQETTLSQEEYEKLKENFFNMLMGTKQP